MKKLTVSLALVFAAGCTGGGSSNGTINGRVTNDASFAPVSGAVVTAFEVQADGSLSAISDSVTTDVTGSYSLDVAFSGSTISDVVVEAEGVGSAIVSATIHDGSTVSAPPITGETTVESSIYVSARASFDSRTTTEGLRAFVDAELAAVVSLESDVETLASCIVLGLRARAQMLVHSSVGLTQSQVNAFLEAEADARAELDAALHAALNPLEIDAALSAYVEMMLEAESSIGITPAEIASSVQAESTAFLSSTASLSSEVLAEARITAERVKAEATARANATAFVALQSSGSVMAGLENARVQLVAAIEASGGAQSSISNAWVSYNAYVRNELEAQVDSIQAGGAAAIDTVQTSVTTARATLQSSLTSAGSDVDAIVEAYGSFTAAVYASASADATLSQMTSAHLEATSSVLASLNVN